MMRMLGSLGRLAEARVRDAGRRAGLRAGLAAGAALAGLLVVGFLLAAATVALAERLGLVNALLVMAGGAFVVALILMLTMRIQARRDRRAAAIRSELDSRLLRAAALSMVPTRTPSRPVVGLGLVALGALLVLMRGKGGDDRT